MFNRPERRIAAAVAGIVVAGIVLAGMVTVVTGSAAAAAGAQGRSGASALYDPGTGNAEVYYNDGHLHEMFHTPTGWITAGVFGAGHDADMAAGTTPAAIYDPINGNLEVYYNNDGYLYETYYSPGAGWSRPQNLVYNIFGSPAVVYDPDDNAIEVYYAAAYRQPAEMWYTAGVGWSGPVTLAGAASGVAVADNSSPSVVYDPDFHAVELYFKGVGGDGATYLYEDYHDGTGWTTEVRLTTAPASAGVNGVPDGSPSAVFDPAAHAVEVYYSDGYFLSEMYHNSSGWSPGPVVLTVAVLTDTTPAALYDPRNGNLEVYFNAGGWLYELYHTPTGWSPLNAHGAPIRYGPVAMYDGANRSVEVYFNSGNKLTERYWDGTNWFGPNDLGPTIFWGLSS